MSEKLFTAINQRTGQVLCCYGAWRSLQGTHHGTHCNRDRMEHGEGLLIPGGPVNGMAIHTVGMSFSIDVLFLDRENYVRLVAWNMGPWPYSSCVPAPPPRSSCPPGSQTKPRSGIKSASVR